MRAPTPEPPPTTSGPMGSSPARWRAGVAGASAALLAVAIGASEPPAVAASRRAAAADVTAVHAEVTDTTGVTLGAHGISGSFTPGSAGVVGESLATAGATCGVRGRVDSPAGIAGLFDNPEGGTILRGLTDGAEVFRVDGSGAMIAASFVGDGAALTDLDPAQLAAGSAAIDIAGQAATANEAVTASDLVCSACVEQAELAFDPATQADLDAVDGALTAHVGDLDNPHAVTLDQLTPTALRGDLLVADGTAVVRLPAGGDGQVLRADATAAAGLRWDDGDRLHPERLALGRWFDARSAITLAVGDGPSGLTFDGTHLWVANSGDDTVSKLRASDGAPLGTFPVGDEPRGIDFDGAHVWVANNLDDTVSKLRASDGGPLGTFPVGGEPFDLVFSGAAIWVIHFADDTVSKLRASDGAPLGTFPVGDGPRGVAFDGTHVWVVNNLDDTVTRLRASDGAPLGTFPVGDRPFGIAFDGMSVWVANGGDGTVSRLRSDDGALLGTFPVGFTPFGVAFDGTHVWVANVDSETVSRLRASDGADAGTFAVGGAPGAVAFDGANVWVARFSSDSVSKL